MDVDIGSLEIGLPSTKALYLSTVELHTCLILFDDFIVEEGFFIGNESLGYEFGLHSLGII
jgi:hypothetical protein